MHMIDLGHLPLFQVVGAAGGKDELARVQGQRPDRLLVVPGFRWVSLDW